MNWIKLLTQEELKKYSTVKYYKNGEVIFNETDICKKIGYIEKGEISIITNTYLEKEETINFLRKNEFFGDVLLFSSNDTYLGHVVCEKDCTIRFFDEDDLFKLFENKIILKAYLNNITSKTIKIKNENKLLKHKNITDRIMYYLYEEASRKNTNIIKIKNITNLAKILSIPRPSLSRELSRLQKENSIIINKIGQMCYIKINY